ncbi:MAG: ComF family protein [Planctomycetota bacterium]|nr:MAG: ComF family protein [Planctomycetota bacterium]
MARCLGPHVDALLDAVYPPACRLCGAAADDGWSCAEHRLPEGPPGERCGRCAGRLPRGLPDGYPCAECRGAPPRFGRAVVALDYRASEAGRAWILALKHGGRRDLAAPLGAVLGRRLLAVAARAEDALLVPVPLHPLRRLERGYDQALLLARAVGRAVDLDVARALVRRRSTRVQGAPGSPSRTANVRGAFRLDNSAEPSVAGRAVWLVDDVVTSGATANECARVLRRAGARRVDVLALARAG